LCPVSKKTAAQVVKEIAAGPSTSPDVTPAAAPTSVPNQR
jgi:hypothetical protein